MTAARTSPLSVSTTATTTVVWRILIVDDSPDDRAEVRRLLLTGSEKRYEFVEAETGRAAIDAVLAASPTCIVLDYHLPDMNAPAVLAAITGHDGIALCPVVVTTGSAATELGRVALRAGAQDFLGKAAMMPESLSRAVENAVERWAMTRELHENGVALRENEARLRGILRQSPAGILQTDAVGRMTLVNARWCEMLGYPEADLLGVNVFDITHASSVPATRVAMSRLAAGGPDFQLEMTYLRKDGSLLNAQSNVTAVRSPEGGFLGLIAVVLDVTERLRIDQELREKTMFLQRVAEITPGVLHVFDLAEKRAVFVNRSMGTLLGFPPDVVQGMGDEIVSRLMHPADLPRFEQHLDGVRALADGEVARFEHRMRDHEGEWHWFHSCDAIFARDEMGRARQLIGVATDITERKRAEEELRDGELRMRLATETTEVGIWEWNIITGKIRWDAQMFRIYGVAPTATGLVPYETFAGAMLAEDLHRQDAALQHTIRTNGKGSREFRIRRLCDGECRVVRSDEIVRANAHGQAEWILGTNLDITERRRADEELRRLAAELSMADQHKDEFLATLAHELRNPLAPIRNGLHVMRLSGASHGAVAEVQTMMERQLAHLVRLVDDLLDVSRIRSGKLALQVQRIEFSAVVDNAVEANRPLIALGGHELIVVVPPEPIFLVADATRLVQVFSNILNNAAKYCERGGRIWLTVERQGNDLVTTITDTGVGIATDMLPKIFEMFTQVDPSLDKAQGGLGIGLSLVQRLVEMHGGKVEARSEGNGKGSEFVVRLPIELPVAQEKTPPAEHVPPTRSFDHRRILVADDNEDAASSLAMMLKLMGNDVSTANNGLDAVQIAAVFQPDVILLDIGMPRMNGYEACSRIRAQTWSENVVLIALTGWGQDEDRRRSREAGFDHHLVKPVDPVVLEQFLAGALLARGSANLLSM